MASLESSVAASAPRVPAQARSKSNLPSAMRIMSDNKREQAVRERAYAIWEQEGRPGHRDLSNWLRAEAEIDTRPHRIPVRAKRSI
jgi:hypothetical protein